jgi:hypothetical protein
MFLRSAFLIGGGVFFFCGKKQNSFSLGTTVLMYSIIRIFGLSDVRLKEDFWIIGCQIKEFCCKNFKITISLLKHEVHKK